MTAKRHEAAGKVGYWVEIGVSDIGPSLAECRIVRMINGKIVPVVAPDGTIGHTTKADQADENRFIVKGDPDGDPKKTLAIALLEARDRVAWGAKSDRVVD